MNPTLGGILRADPDLFEEMSLPTGIDRDALSSGIVEQFGECDVITIYPPALKSQINAWADRMLWRWQKMADILAISYDPTHTYQRHEVTNRNQQTAGSLNRNDTSSSTEETSGTTSGSESGRNSWEDSSRHNVYAYNSSTATPASSDSGDGSGTDSRTTSGSASASTEKEGSATRTDATTGTLGETIIKDITGKLDAASYAKLLMDQRDLIESLDLYEMIITDFGNRFIVAEWGC